MLLARSKAKDAGWLAITTGWAADAQASFVGLSDDTTALDLWRAVVEALAYSYRRMWDEILPTAADPRSAR